MNRATGYTWFLSASLFVVLAIQSPAKIPTKQKQQPAEPHSSQTTRTQIDRNYGNLQLAFEPNVGQTDSQVRFLARGGGMTAYFTDSETVMVIGRGRPAEGSAGETEQAVVRMKLAGADRPRSMAGAEKLPGVSNYFLGNDPAKWRRDVPHYGRIQYDGVYPGIDLVWYGNQRLLEYDFVVAPGADPKQIQVAYEGVESLWVDGRGNLVLRTAIGEIRQQKPRVYQQAGGRKVEIAARYTISATNQVSFEVARYDRKRELRIDPVILVYSTYLGGSGIDGSYAIALDGAGSAYVAGSTKSTNFPTRSPLMAAYQGGSNDVVVTKLAAAGNALVYSTYLGGSGDDQGFGIAVDSAGSAYLTGLTMSSNFPTLSAYQGTLQGTSDAFVTKLAPAGNVLAYSTYLGGGSAEQGNAIALDSVGSAYVTGFTRSTNFPTQSAFRTALQGSMDVFVTKLAAAGSTLAYSTYLGGNSAEYGNGIAVDGAGSAYVAGHTYSTDFPTQSPYQATFQGGMIDAYVSKLSPAGNALTFSTYLGGSGSDQARGIAVDSSGSAYVTGYTDSVNFPTLSAYQAALRGGRDAFVTKLAPAGSSLAYSTYLGGDYTDDGQGIAVDLGGSAYLTGSTASTNFPVQSAYQAASRGGQDAFVTKLAPAGGTLSFSSYLGGNNYDNGNAVAADTSGSVYVTGYTLESTDFPTQSAYQPTYQGSSDGFVTKIQLGLGSPITLSASVSAASGAAGGVTPGEIVAIYGAGLGPAAGVANSGWDPVTGKLPNVLGGTSVTFDGQAAPLFYVVGGQINVQVPYEVAGKASTNLVVTYNGASSAATSVPVVASHTGVFVYNDRAIITNNATGALITAASPIVRGGDVVVWATGPGVVAPAVTTGAPVTTLSHATNPQVWIGGNPVEVQFAGMTPGMAGLMQINLRVPANAPTGANVPLKISINGVEAQAYIGGAVTSNLAIAIQ